MITVFKYEKVTARGGENDSPSENRTRSQGAYIAAEEGAEG